MAVMVGLLLPMVVALAGLGINHASLWTERRRLTLATDAAALAAASVRVTGGSAAAIDATCRDLLTRNHSPAAAAAATCAVEGTRAVRVTASAPAPLFLVPDGLGLDASVSAASLAEGGSPAGIVGSRPMAICNRAPALVDWRTRRDPNVRYTIRANDACPGSERVRNPSDAHRLIEKAISAADAGNNESTLNALMARGTDYELELCDPLGTRENWTSANQGGLPAAVGTTFPVAIYGYSGFPLLEGPVAGCGNASSGGRTLFPVIGFVGMRVHAASVSGSTATFTVSFLELDVSGSCCSRFDLPGTKVVHLCDPVAGCPAPR